MTSLEHLLCFCSDLRKGNWAGNPPICGQTKFSECPECSDCECGDQLLRIYRLKL